MYLVFQWNHSDPVSGPLRAQANKNSGKEINFFFFLQHKIVLTLIVLQNVYVTDVLYYTRGEKPKSKN